MFSSTFSPHFPQLTNVKHHQAEDLGGFQRLLEPLGRTSGHLLLVLSSTNNPPAAMVLLDDVVCFIQCFGWVFTLVWLVPFWSYCCAEGLIGWLGCGTLLYVVSTCFSWARGFKKRLGPFILLFLPPMASSSC